MKVNIAQIKIGTRLRQARKAQELAESIKEIGLLNPITLDREYNLIAGLNRLEAHKILGLTEIDCHFTDLTGLQAQLAEIDENLIRDDLNALEYAQWLAKRKDLYLEIYPQTAKGGDFRSKEYLNADSALRSETPSFTESTASLTNQSKRTIETNIAMATQLADFDLGDMPITDNKTELLELAKIAKREPEKAQEIVEKMKTGMTSTVKQSLKELRKEQQINTESESLESKPNKNTTVTSDQSIIQCDAVITDPPYGILNEEWDKIELEKFTREWLSRWNECGADIFIATWSERHLFEGKKWFDNELTNYTFQQLLIWHYPNNKGHQSQLGFKHTFEPILFYRKNGSTKKIGVGGGEWGEELNDFDCHVSATPQSNFNNENMKQHPAQKSIQVMRWLVNATTNKGDMVVDPFCGSGTTGIACAQLDRSFHGIEKNEEYIQLAKNRIATYG